MCSATCRRRFNYKNTVEGSKYWETGPKVVGSCHSVENGDKEIQPDVGQA